MKKIPGLKNMKAISRGALTEALQGKYVVLAGVIHLPDWEDNANYNIRSLEGQIEEIREKNYVYIHAGLFRKTSKGYIRGYSVHYWQKGDYCFTYLGIYVVVSGRVIRLLMAV